MTWDEVARRIDDGAAAILPIGAAAKQHGFHLPLNTDRIQAEWLAAQTGGAHRRADLADADLRPLSGLRRLCRKHQPVGSDVRSARARNRSGHSRHGCRAAVRARHRHQHAGAGRARAGAARRRPGQAFADPRRPALSPRGRSARRAEPWQPCRRARDLADAGDRAATGRHGARRGEPCAEAARRRAPDAVGPGFAELQPLRQLWRSDAGDGGQGRNLARGHAR